MDIPILDGVAEVRAPETAELLAVAGAAASRGMFLITNGRETRISPYVMPGWFRMGVRVKEAA